MKTYSLSCKSMGIEDCNYVAMGESREDVKKMAGEHFKKAHPEEAKSKMEEMSNEELDEQMESNIIESDDEEEI